MQTRRRTQLLLALVAAIALILTACSGSDDTTSTETADTGSTSSDTSADTDSADTDSGNADDEAEPEPTEAPVEPADEADAEEGDAADGDAADSDAAESATASGDAECPETSASWKGVTEDTIHVGVSLLDFDYLVSNGFSPFGWGDQQLAWQNTIDDLNARGGIYCRMIEPVYAFYSPVGTADAEAKCLELTADNDVFIVLFGFVGPAEPANTCIVGQQETALLGGRITPERLEQAVAPWIQLNPADTRTIDILATLLKEAGELDGKTIAVVSAPAQAELHDNAVDALKNVGANVAIELVTESAVGDAVAEDAEWGVLTEVLRGQGVDTVFLNGNVLASSVRNMTAAGFTPAIWTNNDDGLNNLGASVTPDMLDGTLTAVELTDVERWADPGNIACTESLAAANPEIADQLVGPTEREGDEEAWFSAVMSSCSRVAMLELVLLEAGPELTHDSLNAAIESIGEFSVPGTPYNSLGPGKFDASDTFRLGVFDSSIGEAGEIVGIGDAVDVTQ